MCTSINSSGANASSADHNHDSENISNSDVSKLSDLSLTTTEVYDLIDSFSSGDTSPEMQTKIQLAISERNQKTTLMSNLMRMFSDGASQIIRNIRA